MKALEKSNEKEYQETKGVNVSVPQFIVDEVEKYQNRHKIRFPDKRKPAKDLCYIRLMEIGLEEFKKESKKLISNL